MTDALTPEASSAAACVFRTTGSGSVSSAPSASAASLVEIYRIAVVQVQGACAPIVLPIVAKLGPLLTAIGY
jgi:hypothetical protein